MYASEISREISFIQYHIITHSDSASIVESEGHGKKIHCFSGRTFPTLEAGGRFYFFIRGNPQETTDWNAKVLPPHLSSLAVRITVRSVIRRITASDDSCVRGGLHGYKATGHAREKPNLPICACEICDLEIII